MILIGSKKWRKIINKNPQLATAIVIAVTTGSNQRALNTTGVKVCAGGKCVIVKNVKNHEL